MPFEGVNCPQCKRNEKLRRKRKSEARFSKAYNRYKFNIGYYRYLHLHCRACGKLFFIRERYLYEKPEVVTARIIISEKAYLKASIDKPGFEWMRTTAGEFTTRVAVSADCAYIRNYIKRAEEEAEEEMERKVLVLRALSEFWQGLRKAVVSQIAA